MKIQTFFQSWHQQRKALDMKMVVTLRQLLAQILQKLRTTPETRSRRLVPKIMQHKRILSGRQFSRFPEFCFVFQTFNKGHLLPEVLKPFLDLDVQNVILFADGCVDDTLGKTRQLLTGRNHLIVNSNDVHEIRNYRTSIPIAADIFGCRYLVLLQDDDLYGDNVTAWLEQCHSLLTRFEDLAIIGLNAGGNPVGPCVRADDSMQTSQFETWRDDGRAFFRLSPFYTCQVSTLDPTSNGSNWTFSTFVNRAPQVIRLKFLQEVDCFPLDMCPYQYDDYYNCLAAWSNGWKVIHMPVSGVRRDVGIGGMRLVNNVTPTHRPAHFQGNWNKVVDSFGATWENVVDDVQVACQGVKK
jgi:hypothetical protein